MSEKPTFPGIFGGWIDVRDLGQIRTEKKRVIFPQRMLNLYDKHWYDGFCRKVKIEVLDEIK